MRTMDPGHNYQIDLYPAKEETGFTDQVYSIFFRKRIGEKYPGNWGPSYNGTTTQELLRVIISRSLYVDNQESHPANKALIQRSRYSLSELEFRAAERRGHSYERQFRRDLDSWLMAYTIEEAMPCGICGHIFCRKHVYDRP